MHAPLDANAIITLITQIVAIIGGASGIVISLIFSIRAKWISAANAERLDRQSKRIDATLLATPPPSSPVSPVSTDGSTSEPQTETTPLPTYSESQQKAADAMGERADGAIVPLIADFDIVPTISTASTNLSITRK